MRPVGVMLPTQTREIQMSSAPVKNIKVRLFTAVQHIVSGTRDDHRLEFQIDPDTLKPVGDTMWKTTRDGKQRKLSIKTHVNSEIVKEMTEHVNANGLVREANAKVAERESNKVSAAVEKAVVAQFPEGQADAWELVRQLGNQLMASAASNDAVAHRLVESAKTCLTAAHRAGRTKSQYVPPTPEGEAAHETTGAPAIPANENQPR